MVRSTLLGISTAWSYLTEVAFFLFYLGTNVVLSPVLSVYPDLSFRPLTLITAPKFKRLVVRHLTKTDLAKCKLVRLRASTLMMYGHPGWIGCSEKEAHWINTSRA